MFCLTCGTEAAIDAKYCENCGTRLPATGAAAIVDTSPNSGSDPIMKPNAFSSRPVGSMMSFKQAMSNLFRKYLDFKGRASRAEYWWPILACILVTQPINIAIIVFKYTGIPVLAGLLQIINGIITIGLCIPYLSLAVRRLHDTGKTGWWLLLYFTILGIFVLLYWYCKKGSDQHNEYGDPI